MSNLKKTILKKFRDVEIRNGSFWVTPPRSLVTGSCWIVVTIGERHADIHVVDQTLEAKMLNHGTEIFDDLVSEMKRRVEGLGALSWRAFGYGGEEAYKQWIQAKLVQATGDNFFKFVDAYESSEGSRIGIKNFVWALARLKGPEYVQVLKNRQAGEELI